MNHRIESLIDTLKHTKELKTRKNIIKSLGSSESQLVIPVLIEALKEEEPVINMAAAEALERIGFPAMKQLIFLLTSKDERVRGRVARILGKLRNKDAIIPLMSLCHLDPDPLVRCFAIESLVAIDDQHARMAIINGLKDTTSLVRGISVDTLVKANSIDPVEKIELLAESLKDPDPIVRCKSVKFLGTLVNDSVTEHLVSVLQDSDIIVRIEAVKALGNLADSKAISSLVNIIQEDLFTDLQWEATEALGKMGTPAAKDLIIALKSNRREVRFLAAKALGEIKDEESVIPLINALNDGEWLVQEEAARALKSTGRVIISPLIEIVSQKANNLAEEALEKVMDLLVFFEAGKEELKPIESLLLSIVLTGTEERLKKSATELLKQLDS
ncbi:MAG: HEAT repeat domain-containing protein [Candidatus Odinarchaeota archaeon]